MFKISISPEDIDHLPLGVFPGDIVVVDKPGLEYEKAIFYLRRQKILGFDTESRPVFSPGQRNNGVALLQLSGPKKAYLFRVQTLGMRRSLCALLASEKVIKVGAACLDDVRGLQRIHGFKAAGFVDLQKIAWEWGIRDKSVKKLAANILGCRISKAQQLSNWEASSLTEAQCKYAATDAWVCREMYLKLLESERHPLTPDELLPPADKLAREQAQARKEAVQKKQEEERLAARKRRRHRKKKKSANDKADTEKGQG
ncbi:MAG: 3'-5' exonuclease domain-containing protein 2 [Bacteroidales bacterium]|nr:3'-5' exonuclease domain-containing protein 2 [Bacteroidales bacterium]